MIFLSLRFNGPIQTEVVPDGIAIQFAAVKNLFRELGAGGF